MPDADDRQQKVRPDPTGPVEARNALGLSFGKAKTVGSRIPWIVGGALLALIAAYFVAYAITNGALQHSDAPNAVATASATLAPDTVSGTDDGAQWYDRQSNDVSDTVRAKPTPATSALAGSTSQHAPALTAATGAEAGSAITDARLNDLSSGPSSGSYSVGPISGPPTGSVPAFIPGGSPSFGGAAPTPAPHRMAVAFVQTRTEYLNGGGAGQTNVATEATPAAIDTPQPPAGGASDYLDAQVQTPRSPYELQAGTLIPAALAGDGTSDLGGTPRAVVTEDVYDSIAQRHLLIPHGSRLLGSYVSGSVYGQNRMFIVWQRLFFPDGRYLDLGGMASVDQQGAPGINARVDRHLGNVLGLPLLLSALQAGLSVATTPRNTDSGTVVVNTGTSVGQQIGQAGATQITNLATQMSQQALSQAPTLKIYAGARFSIAVERDIAFPGPYVAQYP